MELLNAKSPDATEQGVERHKKVQAQVEAFIVVGERGTEKTKLARHTASTKNFVSITCGEFTEFDEIAAAMRAGYTCCLTEVALLPPKLQDRVVRAADAQKDTLLCATTTRDLTILVDRGVFSGELLRLFQHLVVAPSLRTSLATIETQAATLAAREAQRLGIPIPRFQSQVVDALKSYDFPGNQRELRNMVEQALLLANGRNLLTLGDFPVLARAIRPAAFARRPKATPSRLDLRAIKRQAEEEEYERIVAALRQSDGNVSAAARALDLSRYQLIRRMKKLGMD